MLWCLLLLGKLWYGGASKNQSKSATENEMNPKHDARDNAEETKCWVCVRGGHMPKTILSTTNKTHTMIMKKTRMNWTAKWLCF
jgi:hypothetical protein